MIVEAWPGATDPSDVLKRLYLLEDAPFPVEYVKEALKTGDPNDDRVWLGQANLAIWLGRIRGGRSAGSMPANSAGPRTSQSGWRGCRWRCRSRDVDGAHVP